MPVPLSLINSKIVERSFPFVRNIYGASNLIPAEISITAFAPLAVDNIEVSSLPVLLAEVNFSDAISDRDISMVLSGSGMSDSAVPYAFATDCNDFVRTDSTLEIPVSLVADNHTTIRIAIAMLDSLTLASSHYASAQSLAMMRYVDSTLFMSLRVVSQNQCP